MEDYRLYDSDDDLDTDESGNDSFVAPKSRKLYKMLNVKVKKQLSEGCIFGPIEYDKMVLYDVLNSQCADVGRFFRTAYNASTLWDTVLQGYLYRLEEDWPRSTADKMSKEDSKKRAMFTESTTINVRTQSPPDLLRRSVIWSKHGGVPTIRLPVEGDLKNKQVFSIMTEKAMKRAAFSYREQHPVCVDDKHYQLPKIYVLCGIDDYGTPSVKINVGHGSYATKGNFDRLFVTSAYPCDHFHQFLPEEAKRLVMLMIVELWDDFHGDATNDMSMTLLFVKMIESEQDTTKMNNSKVVAVDPARRKLWVYLSPSTSTLTISCYEIVQRESDGVKPVVIKINALGRLVASENWWEIVAFMISEGFTEPSTRQSEGPYTSLLNIYHLWSVRDGKTYPGKCNPFEIGRRMFEIRNSSKPTQLGKQEQLITNQYPALLFFENEDKADDEVDIDDI